ncbi:anthranilate synthase component I [Geoglobus acetivorans]|uniref:Anthranilate synthase component 1 n=1 Tax=Geoglobus acetivorans TaxID=565033 RepID=A0ABZ3H1E1_GEOAI|nr:anthranilate synthase component I [Geoglobus acetivorans]
MRVKHLEPVEPVKLYSVLREENYPFILESADRHSRRARYSYVSANPDFVVEVGERGTMVDGKLVSRERDPFRALKSFSLSVSGERFSGGFVGYISYDSVLQHIGEKVEKSSVFGHYGSFFAFDHLENRLYFFTDSDEKARWAEGVVRRAKRVVPELGDEKSEITGQDSGMEEFVEDVLRAKEHVFAGDVFQVVISREYLVDTDLSPFQAYLNMREVNPSPYMFCLEFDVALAGSSPETLASVENGYLKVNPIAGTARRGRDEKEDAKIVMRLLEDEKESAEHVMLVDLARNDVRKVCRAGSVEVVRFMEVLKYSHVMHIESEVRGRLKEGCDVFDAISACFPAGTLTGAPKLRAIEIINEIERSKRGVYGGAVGYFSKEADFAIAIRMAEFGKKVRVRAGAGIVADSVPEKEFFETERKMDAVLRALRVER